MNCLTAWVAGLTPGNWTSAQSPCADGKTSVLSVTPPGTRGGLLSYLVDTNVLSELRRKQPDAQVVAWFRHRPRQSLYLIIADAGRNPQRHWAHHPPAGVAGLAGSGLPAYFLGRLLPVDDRTAGSEHSAGRPLPAIDSLLAATANNTT